MVALLLLSLGVLVVGLVAAVVLTIRSGEARGIVLALLFASLATHQGVALRSFDGAALNWDAATAAAIALAVAGLAGLLALAALWRTLAERDRAESLHWNSMEAVRILGEVASRPNLSLDERLDALLEIGCDRFDLEVGLVSRVDEQRYEVVGYRAPEDFPLSRGSVMMLADTCCQQALASDRPVAYENIEGIARPQPGEPGELGFRAYFGVAVRVFGANLGTLCFGSRSPRRERFTATDKDLLNLMAQWVGGEFERRFALEERKLAAAEIAARDARNAELSTSRAAGAEAAARSRPAVPRHDGRVARSIDVNAALRRSRKKLREAIGPEISLDLRLSDDLAEAARFPVAIGVIVESIVAQIAHALGERGAITIDTANLDLAHRDPDLVPAVAPNRYVTASVCGTGEGIAADSFADAFDPPADGSHRAGAWDVQHDLPLATIYRVLQRSGGDLSVEVEPARSCTFTIFLPAAEAVPTQSRPSAAAPVG